MTHVTVCFIVGALFAGTAGSVDPDCNSTIPGLLYDPELASSWHSESETAYNGSGWISDIRYSDKGYIQFKLDGVWQVKTLTIMRTTRGWYTRTFRVMYSNDALVWTPYNSQSSLDLFGEVFTTDRGDVTVALDPPIEARYISINPLTALYNPSLRISLTGCLLETQPLNILTNFSTDIHNGTIWSQSQSPILIDRQISVTTSGSLHIQAGVSVVFTNKQAGIKVYGTLNASGIDGTGVLFTSNDSLSANKDTWSGIIVEPRAVVYLEFTTIRQAGTGIRGDGTNVRITDSRIYSCVDGAKLIGGSSTNISHDAVTDKTFMVTNSQFVFNDIGLTIQGTQENPRFNFKRSIFSNNSVNGIQIRKWQDTNWVFKTDLMAKDCYFGFNKKYGIDGHDKSELRQLIVDNCTFDSNIGGVYMDFDYSRRLSSKINKVSVRNSHFLNSEGHYDEILYINCLYECYIDSIKIVNNTFNNNKGESIYIRNWNKDGSSITIDIANNTILNNRGYNSINYYELTLDIHVNSSLSVRNNTFVNIPSGIYVDGNNKVDVVVITQNVFSKLNGHRYSSAVVFVTKTKLIFTENKVNDSSTSAILEIKDGFNHVVANNSFVNNTLSSCYIRVGQDYHTNLSMMADYNFWDSTHIDKIKFKICDFFLDASKARVSINAFYLTVDMETVVNNANSDDFKVYYSDSSVYVVGGVITGQLQLPPLEGRTVVVNRSLIVDETASLTISDVIVNVTENRGIAVFGDLQIGTDTGEHTVVRSSIPSKPWCGLHLYNTGVRIINTFVSDAARLISTNYECSVYITETMIENVDTLLYAYEQCGNVNLTIYGSNIRTAGHMCHVGLTDTSRLDIEITDCNCSTDGKVFDIYETRSKINMSYITLSIVSCIITSSNDIARIEACLSHIDTYVTNSTLSSGINSFVMSLKSQSISGNWINNNMTSEDTILDIFFCKSQDEDKNNSRILKIIGNRFNSLHSGINILVRTYSSGLYIKQTNHTFYISNNTFASDERLDRKGIHVNLPSKDNLYSFYVHNNVFINSTSTVIYVYGGVNHIVITNNTFINNSVCIHTDLFGNNNNYRNYIIADNTFHDNSADGVVNFIQPNDYEAHAKVHRNDFKGNSGILILINMPNITFRNNYFDNDNVQYNLKVLEAIDENYDTMIDATLNYWGTTNADQIASKIYDHSYDYSLMRVVFKPYLASRNYSDIEDKETEFVDDSGKIGGEITEEIILANSNKSYTVIFNIQVRPSGALIIEAGVRLYFASGIGMTVEGVLEVRGTVLGVVRFMSANDDQPWKGINFLATNVSRSSYLKHLLINNTLQGVTIAKGTTHLENVTSKFSATNGFSFNLEIKHDSTNVDEIMYSNITASNCTKSGVVIDIFGAPNNVTSVLIQGCSIYGNIEHGVKVLANASVIISDCHIYENKLSGINIKQTNGGKTFLKWSSLLNNFDYAISSYSSNELLLNFVNITGHNFGRKNDERNRKPLLYLSNPVSRNTFTFLVSHCNFSENMADGIDMYMYRHIYALIIKLENNTFMNSNRTLVITNPSNFGNGFAKIKIQGNTIIGNNYTLEQSSLFDFDLNYGETSINITSNVFIRNNVQTVLNFLTRSDSTGNIHIQNNSFKDNKIKYSTIKVQSYNPAIITNNVFSNMLVAKKAECEIVSPAFDIGYNLNATHNFWGSVQVSEHFDTNNTHSLKKEDVICGFEKTMANSFISYIPYYRDAKLEDLVTKPFYNFDTDVDSGGEVSGNVTVNVVHYQSPIVITRSIFVEFGSTLNIGPRVTLQFKENRGIYVAGQLNLHGNQEHNVALENSKVVTKGAWYGVVLDISGTMNLEKTSLINTENGIVAHSNKMHTDGCTIYNSTLACVTLHLSPGTSNDYNFKGMRVVTCRETGILVIGNGNITIQNADIVNATTAIFRKSNNGNIHLKSCKITNSFQAINVLFTDAYNSGNVTIDHCLISNCTNGISVINNNRHDYNTIRIVNNEFSNISSNGLNVNIDTFYYNRYNNKFRSVDISNNSFRHACGIILLTRESTNLSYHDNLMIDSSCIQTEKCYMDAYVKGDQTTNHYVFDISTNIFQNISSECLVKLRSSANYVQRASFYYNQLLANTATKGVVILDSELFNLTQNIFDNPQSPFDVYVTKIAGDTVTNASHNWWGSTDPSSAAQRVFDHIFDANLVAVNITPILTDSTIDCTAVNNCNSHGKCVSPNRCRCNSGWTGPKCADFDCSGVSGCYGNGECIGPNTCDCNAGWTGSQCIQASCSNLADCSEHGVCVRPDVCVCAATFTRTDCSTCVAEHWGPICLPCPDCVQGTCNLQTGNCDCNEVNWSGSLCDTCSETFYGPDCLPLMMLLSILPSQGRDTGGTIVHIWGHNFLDKNATSFICKFGSDVVNGTIEASDHVTCVAPQHKEGSVYVEVSADGMQYSSNKLTFTFFATCPLTACGREFVPPHGQCLFGGCYCNLPWTGEGCSIELLPPIIAETSSHNVAEYSSYSLQLNLTQGSSPVRWSLEKGPMYMTVDARTGLVVWDQALGNPTAHEVKVKASNVIGSSIIEWLLNVPMSYNVTVSHIEPSGVLPKPSAITVYGDVVFRGSFNESTVPIAIKIIGHVSSSRIITLSKQSNPLLPKTFSSTYYPRPDDVGLFTVWASHPAFGDVPGIYNLTWSVKGMRCEPQYIAWSGYIENDMAIYRNITRLINVGGHPIASISIQVYGLLNAYMQHSSIDTVSKQHNISMLKENQEVAFDLVIHDARPLSGTLVVRFFSSEGTETRFLINIRLSLRKPYLVFTPARIRENIISGTQKVFDIIITNSGEVTANNIQVDIPDGNRLSIVSFSKSNENGMDYKSQDGFTTSLEANISAILTLSITINSIEALGQMSGAVVVNTNSTTSSLPFIFFIRSNEIMNLTLNVKDEYTYFADGHPLVDNAVVRLVNPRRGYSETKYTNNQTGYVEFTDLYEDRYSVYAEADGHASYSAILIATTDNTERDIFLERVAVKYTWTVTQTTVQDTYSVTLDSTFETFVPMPVVTIEPAKVDTIPYELGEKDTIEFTVTNHGLIRANNLRFQLPTNHEYLDFVSTIDIIGNLAANTSLVIPVKVNLKSRTERSVASSSGCTGLLLFYEYDCGGTRIRSVGVSLIRVHLSMPCITGHGILEYQRKGRFGRSWGTTRVYTNTQLPCDCIGTIIKSCVLAYIPGLKIAIAGIDLYNAISDGNKELALLHTMDVIMSVGTKFICPICGTLYTTFRCIYDANNCRSDRSRRSVSSEVKENLLQTSRPVLNFLEITAEILGDKNMYTIESVWYQSFKLTISDDSPSATLLTQVEVETILDTIDGDTANVTLHTFLIRWNNTMSAWQNGTLHQLESTGKVINYSKLTPKLEKYKLDQDNSHSIGYDSIFEEFDNAVSAYNTAEAEAISSGSNKDEGICAKVRVRIVQDYVLTRDAFNAMLEIENGENSALEDIHVEIRIQRTYGDGEMAIDQFSIGSPTLVGITDIDGYWSLRQGISGTAEWLIIPYSIAAPNDDVQYNVGGRLSYRVAGSNFSVPLLPDTITVKPNPSLVVHYFHEKYARGDDPLTPEIEPIVPFSLAIMVMNIGNGVARALKISSGQPEIIENEKGLLITFKIIGAQLGKGAIKKSLNVDFGDIASLETKTARWLLTTTLQGTFYNFSATFENINPLGDPQLSLLDELRYHELVHLVRIDNDVQNDDLDDFLVNDVVDNNGMPDRLYNSDNGTDFKDILTSNLTYVSTIRFEHPPRPKHYTSIQCSMTATSSQWTYARLVNNFTTEDEHLLLVESSDQRHLLVDKNVWQTTHILDSFFIHLFDFIRVDNTAGDEGHVKMYYNLTFGPRNIYAPQFNKTSYSASVHKGIVTGTNILKLNAYDIDNDDISFKIEDTEITDIFTVNGISGAVYIIKNPTSDKYVFSAIVSDNGIPSKSTSANITITVIRDTTLLPSTTVDKSMASASSVSTFSSAPTITTARSTTSESIVSTTQSSTTATTSTTATSTTTTSLPSTPVAKSTTSAPTVLTTPSSTTTTSTTATSTTTTSLPSTPVAKSITSPPTVSTTPSSTTTTSTIATSTNTTPLPSTPVAKSTTSPPTVSTTPSSTTTTSTTAKSTNTTSLPSTPVAKSTTSPPTVSTTPSSITTTSTTAKSTTTTSLPSTPVAKSTTSPPTVSTTPSSITTASTTAKSTTTTSLPFTPVAKSTTSASTVSTTPSSTTASTSHKYTTTTSLQSTTNPLSTASVATVSTPSSTQTTSATISTASSHSSSTTTEPSIATTESSTATTESRLTTRSTASFISSTAKIEVTTLSNNASVDESHGGAPSWVVPTAIGLVALGICIVVVFGIVYAVKYRGKTRSWAYFEDTHNARGGNSSASRNLYRVT